MGRSVVSSFQGLKSALREGAHQADLRDGQLFWRAARKLGIGGDSHAKNLLEMIEGLDADKPQDQQQLLIITLTLMHASLNPLADYVAEKMIQGQYNSWNESLNVPFEKCVQSPAFTQQALVDFTQDYRNLAPAAESDTAAVYFLDKRYAVSKLAGSALADVARERLLIEIASIKAQLELPGKAQSASPPSDKQSTELQDISKHHK